MDEAGGPLSSLSLTWFMSVLEHFLGAPSSAQLLTCVCILFICCVPLSKKKKGYVSKIARSAFSDQLIEKVSQCKPMYFLKHLLFYKAALFCLWLAG